MAANLTKENLVTDEVVGERRAVAIEAPDAGWLRVVYVINKDDNIDIHYQDNDPSKLIAIITRAPAK